MSAFVVTPTPDASASGGELLRNVRLADHTSWRVGGNADRFYWPAGSEGLVRFLQQLPDDEPLFWLGLGSNLLVRDGGIRGTVICTRGRLKDMNRIAENRIYVEAGVPSAHVARFCVEQGCAGAEFLAGIPGTMGGALAMNAGAFGGETWSLVDHVLTVDRSGVVRKRFKSEYAIGYRSVAGADGEWFLAAELKLETGDVDAGKEKIRALLAGRAAAQPTNQPNCGSVFRNPEGDFAARLIESSGLKGYAIGDAQVSMKHANFIVNLGSARATDIEALIYHVQQQVAMRHGTTLLPEVRIVGVAMEEV
ncbi:UDP-N-acetylmuramate dehydrogenase [Candidatus Methylospira mobilis]|uniref:UDP-N-acetylmuramate dehydrogenase n=1 Tax=Candidatus Methylospira mobilis TaxID=1808979 RepID=UPI001D17B90E|nr:UDP-N-acetylmuramate dehydrogenase [Candidatus Methylospira mobilis]